MTTCKACGARQPEQITFRPYIPQADLVAQTEGTMPTLKPAYAYWACCECDQEHLKDGSLMEASQK